MSKPYVSEFANFMNQYLENHPNVVEQQKHGADFFWKLKYEKAEPVSADSSATSSIHRT